MRDDKGDVNSDKARKKAIMSLAACGLGFALGITFIVPYVRQWEHWDTVMSKVVLIILLPLLVPTMIIFLRQQIRNL